MPKPRRYFLGLEPRSFRPSKRLPFGSCFSPHAARTLHDLRGPGNSLEALKGGRTTQHSNQPPSSPAFVAEAARGNRYQRPLNGWSGLLAHRTAAALRTTFRRRSLVKARVRVCCRRRIGRKAYVFGVATRPWMGQGLVRPGQLERNLLDLEVSPHTPLRTGCR